MVKVNCPSCGASVAFQSTFSILAVCEHCRSTLVRHDINVEDIGKMATLQVDGSPLQLGVRGEYKSVSFSVVGRIQLRFDRGIWNEWHLTFSDGRSGWLGEAGGTYAVSFLRKTEDSLPEFKELQAGKKVQLRDQSFQVQNVESARCIAGEGELPFRVAGGYDAPVADLLGDQGSFATLDYSEETPLVFVGEYVEFDDLHLTNLREFESWSNAASPKVRAFQCVQCGGAVTQRALLQTTSVVCPSCGAIIDVSDQNLKVLSTFAANTEVTPAIPLGIRGTFPDGEFELIGFLQRFVTVEGVDYHWREYLLFNPYKGFRWLSEYNGHWNYIKSTFYRPKMLGDNTLRFKGKTFRHFQSAPAHVDYVIGEFYWRVQQGESCLVSDFIDPPRMFSVENTEGDLSYSVGEYTEPADIAAAFKLTTPLPPRIGIGASQPSPLEKTARKVGELALAFLALAVAIQLATLAFSQNKLVYQTDLVYKPTDAEKSRVTEVFELDGRTSNVVVRTQANVSNAWIYLSMALINDDTGTAYDFGREIGYYFGSDSDGAWSEGSQSDAVFLPHVPAGHYYLRVEPEGTAPVTYLLQVYRDVPRWWMFLVTVGVIVFFPAVALWMKRSFEYKRWSESDHPMSNLINAATEEDDE
jgi:predicted RNA-binding Zn-ribbon protein involved in translation (DUF1610 family)